MKLKICDSYETVPRVEIKKNKAIRLGESFKGLMILDGPLDVEMDCKCLEFITFCMQPVITMECHILGKSDKRSSVFELQANWPAQIYHNLSTVYCLGHCPPCVTRPKNIVVNGITMHSNQQRLKSL